MSPLKMMRGVMVSWRVVVFLAAAVLNPVFSDDVGIRMAEVPVVENRISLKSVAQETLRLAGSDVLLPETFPDQALYLHPLTLPVGLKVWNGLLQPLGGRVSVEDGRARVQVDLAVAEGRLDEMEAVLLRTFNVERTAVLHRLSAETCVGPPVVLVHGLDSGKRLFHGACAFLVDEGYDVYFFEYPNDDGVERNALRLSETLRGLPAERRKGLTLVTISMGGVISQWMLENPDLYVEGVERLIACVPPFQGSEMAALRGFVELGDHALDVVFDPGKALDVWGDGMGRAGIDLLPNSLLMEKLAALERNPRVAYSILAGNRGLFEPGPVRRLRNDLAETPADNPLAETARLLAVERLDVLLKFQTPLGDGAVALESAVLEGVTDRMVLPYHHLQFLTGFTPGLDRIPALDAVRERLPEP